MEAVHSVVQKETHQALARAESGRNRVSQRFCLMEWHLGVFRLLLLRLVRVDFLSVQNWFGI